MSASLAMASQAERLLQRALDAEEQLQSLQERTTSLELRLRAVLNNDPASATRALAWMGRAQNSEHLLNLLLKWIAENPSVEELLPRGFVERVRAQLHSVEVLKRDQEAFGEKPPDEEWWTRFDKEPGVRVE